MENTLDRSTALAAWDQERSPTFTRRKPASYFAHNAYNAQNAYVSLRATSGSLAGAGIDGH